MKRVLLTLALCSVVAVAGCGKKNTTEPPKSLGVYQELNLTVEQNKKLADIRKDQRQKMEAIRKEMEAKRNELLDVDGTKNFSDAEKKANHEKYRAAAAQMRDKMAAQRTAYDNAFMGILNADQKKIYQNYIDQRESERVKREKNLLKK